jgi:phosphoribosylglycinamide formyltransferase-1
MKKIAIFASGSGTNFEVLVNKVEEGFINAKVVLMVCDNPNAYVIERAKNHNINSFIFNPRDYDKKSEYEAIIVEKLRELDVDLICLAGYMRICGKTFLAAYEGKIINIHPALLPSFKGAHGILDAFNYGVKVYGVTIHYVDSGMDSGKIIEQRAFYYDGKDIDELETKIHAVEHELYPLVVKKMCEEN